MLIVLAGLPGSGKSTVAGELARRLPAPVLSVDPVEAALWQAGVERDQPTGLAAYVVVEAMASDIVSLGQSVVVDAVNDAAEAREQWRSLARRQEVPLVWIEVRCSDPGRHRRRLEGRTRQLPGFPEPTWDSLAERGKALASWNDQRLVLDTVRSVGTNVEAALEHLRSVRVRENAGEVSSTDTGPLRRVDE